MYSRIRTATARTTGLPPDWKVWKLRGEDFENLIANVPKLRGEEFPRAQQRFQSGVTYG